MTIGGHLRLAADFGQTVITGHPHTSAVRYVDWLREPRPRAGRSAWWALYRQVGEVFVVAEGQSDPRGFERVVRQKSMQAPRRGG